MNAVFLGHRNIVPEWGRDTHSLSPARFVGNGEIAQDDSAFGVSGELGVGGPGFVPLPALPGDSERLTFAGVVIEQSGRERRDPRDSAVPSGLRAFLWTPAQR